MVAASLPIAVPTGIAIFYMAIPVGTASGYLLGGLIESALGWRAAFYVVGLPGIVMALLALTAPDPPRGLTEEDAAPRAKVSVVGALRSLSLNFTYVGAILGYVAYTFALGGLQLWMPKFLSEVRGLELTRADSTIGALTVLAGLGGTVLGG